MMTPKIEGPFSLEDVIVVYPDGSVTVLDVTQVRSICPEVRDAFPETSK